MFEVGFYDEKVLEIYQSFSIDIRAKFQRLFHSCNYMAMK